MNKLIILSCLSCIALISCGKKESAYTPPSAPPVVKTCSTSYEISYANKYMDQFSQLVTTYPLLIVKAGDYNFNFDDKNMEYVGNFQKDYTSVLISVGHFDCRGNKPSETPPFCPSGTDPNTQFDDFFYQDAYVKQLKNYLVVHIPYDGFLYLIIQKTQDIAIKFNENFKFKICSTD